MNLFPWEFYFGKDELDAQRPLNRWLNQYGVVRTFITLVMIFMIIGLALRGH